MSLLNPFIFGGGINYYVSESGSGTGLSPADPMSMTAFLLITLHINDKVFFAAGSTF